MTFISNRNYDEDFEDDDEGAVAAAASESLANKRAGLAGNANTVSPPQRLGSNSKSNDLDERWKD